MTASITIRDSIAYLDITDPELLEIIQESTSFRDLASEYALRGGKGKKNLVKLIRNNKCPVGLLDRVCRVMDIHGVIPEIHYADTQQAQKPGLLLKLRDIVPRDYQEEASLAAALSNRGIFRAPTGSGKSLIALMILIAKRHHGLIVVPTKDLLHQFRDFLTEHLSLGGQQGLIEVGLNLLDPVDYRIGQMGDGVVDPQQITVATIRTIAKVLNVAYQSYEYAECDDSDETKVDSKQLKEWVESIGTVIIDEAHMLGARVLFDTVTKIPALNKYGMSASPWRDDGADLMIEAATGPTIYYVPAKRLVKDGYLLAPEIRIIDTSSWWVSAAWGSTCANCKKQWLTWTRECVCGCSSFTSQFQEAYRKEIVENPIRNGKIAELIIEIDRPTLALVKQVKHGKLLEDIIPGSIFLSGKNKGSSRKAVFDQVRGGHLNTLICTQIGDMGLDIPNLGALVLIGGGKSSTRHLQRMGRVVRPFPGKPKPIIIDFNDSHIHGWYENHEKKRRQIEHAEWDDSGATWEYV